MPEQGSLFAALEKPKAIPAPTPAKPPKYRLPLERYEVKSPWGGRDGKGNQFWEKMHRELEKMPVELRERFNDLTAATQPEYLDRFEKCLRLLRNANEFDKIDWDVSRGKLRND